MFSYHKGQTACTTNLSLYILQYFPQFTNSSYTIKHFGDLNRVATELWPKCCASDPSPYSSFSFLLSISFPHPLLPLSLWNLVTHHIICLLFWASHTSLFVWRPPFWNVNYCKVPRHKLKLSKNIELRQWTALLGNQSRWILSVSYKFIWVTVCW